MHCCHGCGTRGRPTAFFEGRFPERRLLEEYLACLNSADGTLHRPNEAIGKTDSCLSNGACEWHCPDAKLNAAGGWPGNPQGVPRKRPTAITQKAPPGVTRKAPADTTRPAVRSLCWCTRTGGQKAGDTGPCCPAAQLARVCSCPAFPSHPLELHMLQVGLLLGMTITSARSSRGAPPLARVSCRRRLQRPFSSL